MSDVVIKRTVKTDITIIEKKIFKIVVYLA